MKKNKIKANTLIKQKGLMTLIKEYNLRVSKRAIKEIERFYSDFTKEGLTIIKQHLLIQGRKTLLPEDINLLRTLFKFSEEKIEPE